MNFSKMVAHRELFGLNYVGIDIIVEFDYRMSIAQNRHIIRDPIYKTQRLDMFIWIAS